VVFFGIGNGETGAPSSNLGPTDSPVEANAVPSEPVEANKPLKFTLKVAYDHPYLKERGIEPELAEEFGVGFCKRGMMKDHIAISIHDSDGQLVAYAGRWVSEELPEGEEKYKLPPGFKKSIVLYNLHRVKGVEPVFVVEGFFSVMRLHKLGIHAIALMGRSLSEEQEKLLQENGVKSLMLMLDGDPPGREAQAALLQQLGEKFLVGAVDLPDGGQPDTVDESFLYEVLS
jgi:DNA primase